MQTGKLPLADDEISEKTLTSTGSLRNTSTCYVFSETFKLLPHSLGRTLAGIKKARIILLRTEDILKSDEKDSLQRQPSMSVPCAPPVPTCTRRPR